MMPATANFAARSSRSNASVASTVLGSVASGLVHAAAVPVLVVPEPPTSPGRDVPVRAFAADERETAAD